MGGAHHTERGAVADAGKRPGVAMREHARVLLDERRSVGTDRTIDAHIVVRNANRLCDGITRGERAIDGPREIHGRGPSRIERGGRALLVLTSYVREGDAHRSGGAECGRTTDGRRANAVAQLVDRRGLDDLELAREPPLIDEPNAIPRPLDGRRDRIAHPAEVRGYSG